MKERGGGMGEREGGRYDTGAERTHTISVHTLTTSGIIGSRILHFPLMFVCA
jgi:hypothetical protein